MIFLLLQAGKYFKIAFGFIILWPFLSALCCFGLMSCPKVSSLVLCDVLNLLPFKNTMCSHSHPLKSTVGELHYSDLDVFHYFSSNSPCT